MATLYRQYRPQYFRDLYGQNHITDTLQKALTSGRIAHAYVFHGPRGTGKTTTARILSKRLNCTEAKDGEPCGKCQTCIATQNNQNIDVIEIDAASNRGIDDIRALKDGIMSSPSMGKYKVYIIDEVHMLTHEAFTALLKTLEEPVKHAIFILATTEFHKVPATILSRCQIYRFRRATADEMKARLTFILQEEKRTANNEALDFIISRSDGCYRDAESLLGQILTIQDNEISVTDLTEFLGLPPREMINTFVSSLIKNESAGAVVAVDEAFARGLDPEQFLQESIVVCREGALSLIKNEKSEFSFVTLPGALAKLPAIIRALIQATQDLAYVPQPLIALHLAIISLTTVRGSAPVTTPTPVQSAPVAVPKTQPTTLTPPPTIIKDEPTTMASAQVAAVTVGEVVEAWPKLILAIREKNPVSSTFIRAMEPVAVEGSVVRLQAFYALHKNFFEKPENRLPMEQALSEILGTKLELRCFMADAATAAPLQAQKQQKQSNDLLAAVQNAFGTP
jgi:DNA polymerase-3 subunit gamma/tau